MFGAGGFSGGSKGGPHYEIEVNEGSVNMKRFASAANDRHANGYRHQYHRPHHHQDCYAGRPVAHPHRLRRISRPAHKHSRPAGCPAGSHPDWLPCTALPDPASPYPQPDPGRLWHHHPDPLPGADPDLPGGGHPAARQGNLHFHPTGGYTPTGYRLVSQRGYPAGGDPGGDLVAAWGVVLSLFPTDSIKPG